MKPFTSRPFVRAKVQPHVSSFRTLPFNHEWSASQTREQESTRPSTNILRLENGYQIQLAVPGVAKDLIQIQVVGDQLVVSATNPNQETPTRFLRQEFNYNGFKRSFTLHKNADMENLQANFEQGILTIVIPDKEPETRKIEIH